jgi:ribosomal protein L39E
MMAKAMKESPEVPLGGTGQKIKLNQHWLQNQEIPKLLMLALDV